MPPSSPTRTPPPPALIVDRPRVEDYAAHLARNLVAARAAAGLTQHQLAARSRISRGTIAQLETSGCDPRLSTVILLAAALNLSPLTLLAAEPSASSQFTPARRPRD